MTIFDVSENAALELLNKVNLAKRVAAIYLTDNDFGSKSRVQKQKRRDLSEPVSTKFAMKKKIIEGGVVKMISSKKG